jgi:hypothetical protein
VAVSARRFATGVAASATVVIATAMGLARHDTAAATTPTSRTALPVQPGVTIAPTPTAGLPSDDGWPADDGWPTDDGQSVVVLPQGQGTPSPRVVSPTILAPSTGSASNGSTHGSR